jgi:hypothetical protein
MLRLVIEALPRGLFLSALLCSWGMAEAERLYGLPELIRKAHKAQAFEDSFLADARHRLWPVAQKDGPAANEERCKIGRLVA